MVSGVAVIAPLHEEAIFLGSAASFPRTNIGVIVAQPDSGRSGSSAVASQELQVERFARGFDRRMQIVKRNERLAAGAHEQVADPDYRVSRPGGPVDEPVLPGPADRGRLIGRNGLKRLGRRLARRGFWQRTRLRGMAEGLCRVAAEDLDVLRRRPQLV